MTNPLEIVQAFNGIDDISLQVNSSRLKALAWARVSTEMQDAKGHSIPEQLKQIREYAEKNDIEIAAEYSEAASAYQSRSKRLEFVKMLQHAQDDSEISIILIHDFSRFSRDSTKAKTLVRELKDQGIKIVSLNDPEFDTDTVAGVYMEAITYAKNEAYSKEVAFHTRKACKANIRTRDEETGWCYKNGGIPLWGYKAVRLERGFERKGVPIIKVIWGLDNSIVAGKPVHEWVRHCLVELAMKGASIVEIRDFCNRQEIPARRNKHWSHSSWKSLLTAPALLKFCGYEVWNVRRKNGSFKPMDEWEIVENAHPAIITEDEAKTIAEVRKSKSDKQRFDKGYSRSKRSKYLLSGGMFTCSRCGKNMIGYKKAKGQQYYICGSLPYRKGMGCGAGVYVPQQVIEEHVIDGLMNVLTKVTSKEGFAKKVNQELKQIWEQKTGITDQINKEQNLVESKIKNIYTAIEEGLPFDLSTQDRLQILNERKTELDDMVKTGHNPPHIDSGAIAPYITQLKKVLRSTNFEDSKKLLRTCVDKMSLDPKELEITINYRFPEPVVNCSLTSPR